MLAYICVSFIERFYNSFNWHDENFDETYFGWDNGNKKLHIKDNVVYIKFVNEDHVEKRFQTFDEANTYYQEVLKQTIKIKIHNEES